MSNQFPQPISQQIWERKYRLTTMNPDIADDKNVHDTWVRIAKACANAYHALHIGSRLTLNDPIDRTTDMDDYLGILEDFNFLPAGRITAGAGSGRNVTLFNCFVMGTIPDNIAGIFDMIKESAITMQLGGGIGFDFSPLRPAGSPVKGVDADASGPLTFMDVWDAMCRTIMSAGARRGAMMATMRVDHPDIEAFIVAKQDKTRLRMFNLSVLCTDEFMKAVKEDSLWNLRHERPPIVTFDESEGYDEPTNTYLHKTIRARDLWELIMKSTYDHAEPGVIFIDHINQANNLWYAETISATNPCGEQPLPPYGACLLGSINLAKMVDSPFGPNCNVNYTRLRYVAKVAVRMLDSVIDISNYPLPQQKAEALDKRRMGIGITGLADLLFMMNSTYGSYSAQDLAGDIMETITLACYRESIDLAQRYGPCPATETSEQRELFIESGFMAKMPADIKKDILKYGIRNALLTSIAPTGTVSLYAGNVSSGIEPIFAAEYTRKVLKDDGVTQVEETVEDYAVHLLKRIDVDPIMPRREMVKSLATAQTLPPSAHLKMLTAVQPWVDSSISKTINCPEDISYEDFTKIYMDAYNRGLKGCTTYRPNDVTGSVLSVESDVEPEATVDAQEQVMLLQHPITEPMERPENLKGTTYKLKWDGKSYYVTMNDYADETGKVIPFEIFIHSSSMESLQWTVALTRMISAVFRRGGQVDFIGEELKRISDPTGGQWVKKKFVPSFVALLGQCIGDHIKGLNGINEEMLIEDDFEIEKLFDLVDPIEAPSFLALRPPQCPECHEYSMEVSGGCETCTSCGYSKCG